MSIRSALAYTFSTRYFSMGLQFLATLILARLLTPEEIGVYSVGAAVIMIAHTLRDFGTSTYVIQEQELTRARQGTAFALTIMVAWCLALALWLGSRPIAHFYHDARVGEVLEVMALNFALIPFGSISMAIIRREMNFRSIMFITLVSTFVHSGVSVVLAALGFGFISLAWAAVCGTLTTVIGALIANPAGFFLKPTFSEMRHVLAFSLRSSVSSIASEAGHAAPDIVLGRTVGMEGTGLFSRAMGYVQLFERLLQDVLRSVMLPYLSEIKRAGSDMREKLLLVLDNVVSVSFFIIGLTAVLAQPMVALLYGPQWDAVVPLAQVLCIAMLVRCIAPTLAAALVANGQITLVMRTSVVSAILKFASLILFSRYGLQAGANGFVLAETLNVIVLLHYSNRSGFFSWASYSSIVLRNIPIALLGILPAVGVMLLVPVPKAVIPLVGFLCTAGIGSISVWLLSVIVFDRAPKSELAGMFVSIRKKFR